MQHCEFCGSELPGNAQFCGSCGHVVSNATEALTAASDVSAATWVSSNTPSISGPQSLVGNTRTRLADEKSTIGTDWLGKRMIENGQVSEESRTLGPDLLLPGMIAGSVQGFGGDVPMVQGTPQIGSVPTVRGTPPGFSASPHHMANPQTPPLYHAARTSFPQDILTPPPNHAPGIRSLPQKHSATSRLGTGRRRLVAGSGVRWLMVVIAVIVVAVTSGILAAIAFNPSPTLSLSGSSNVALGGMLSLHGRGFSSGASVILTLDHGLPLSFADRPLAKESKDRAPIEANLATASLLLSAGQAEQSNSPNAPGTTIRASSSGTFDIQIAVQQNWSAGQHTLQAKEANNSRSATLTFYVVAQTAKLAVNPLSLDFGSLEVGSKVFQSIVIVNAGGQRLTWTADSGGTKWLKVLGSSGAIEPGGPQEFIYVMADTSQLSVGDYTATLTINSNGSKAQVGVKLSIVSSAVKQAKLSINPSNLDFGQVPVGQQATMGLTVSNAGTQLLNWTADTGSTKWLSLSVNAGKIDAGQQPEMIQVSVDTTNMPPGKQSATLQFNSNGGSIQVSITVNVTMAAKPPTPLLTGMPNSFSVPGDANCTYDANSGWTCVASLSSYKTAQVNLDWTASSTGVSGVSFSPQSGSLTPGQTAKVTINIPNTACPTNADFMFTGPGNTLDLSWSCAAPNLSASPGSFTANSDCSLGANLTWTCTAMVSSDAKAQGNLNWSASGSKVNGITFSPQSGVLSPGQSTTVTIMVPTSCPASATLTFTGPANTVSIPWSCNAPTLAANQVQFNTPGSNCSYSAGQGWTCTTMLMNQDTQQSLTWSATSSGVSGITVSPSSGTLSPGQTSPVTFFVPDTICPANATITFMGPANSVNVTWSCTAPSLAISSSSFTNTSCTQNSDGSWTCSETLSLAQGSQGNLAWSAVSDLSGVTFNPANGTLLSSSPSLTVSINIPSTDCTSGTFTFSGQGQGANSATASWSCTPSSTAQGISPSSIKASNYSNNSTVIVMQSEGRRRLGLAALLANRSQMSRIVPAPRLL